MSELLTVALSFPTVVFTVLLGFLLVYALLSVLGALQLDWLTLERVNDLNALVSESISVSALATLTDEKRV